MPMQNMNAMCHCNHRLSQHHKVKGCGHCGCTMFTERLWYQCAVCEEFISILEAPNDQVSRLTFRDSVRGSYCHTKCLPKRLRRTVFKNDVKSNSARAAKYEKTNKELKDEIMEAVQAARMTSKQVVAGEDVFRSLIESAGGGGIFLSRNEAGVLVCLLARYNVFDPAGDIDPSVITEADELKLLQRLKEEADRASEDKQEDDGDWSDI